ncbi:MAG TPA: Stp1/IreP family PP2C-type Ser/Thr phosphatase [Thermoanaerobaculia bacterium]
MRTDVGLVRSENQDFGIYTSPDEERQSALGGRLLVVADGMGGHRGGATASRLAAETVKAQYLGSETPDVPTALREALARANKRIYTEAQANPDLRGMGTTTSALTIRDGAAWFAHVGDSRIYLVRGDEIRQLTDDHSLVASMVREGLLTSAEAENHPRRNVLQRSLGVAEDVEIDVSGPFKVQDGDIFILCSDGLHGLVKEAELKEIAKLPIDQAADEYLKRALERGAPDNVTVIVARVEGGGDFGDETMSLDDEDTDEFEATQPVAPVDPSLYDETMRDAPAQPLQAATEPVPAVEPAPAPAIETAPAVDAEPTLQYDRAAESGSAPLPATATSTKTGKGFLVYILLIAIGLAAAGAWYYWS